MQFTYLGTMYRNRVFDNVVHEHLTYFSLSSLKWLLARFNLYITDAELVETYGGSLRVKIQKTIKGFNSSSVEQILFDERMEGTNTVEKLSQFGKDFNDWITSFKDFYSAHNFYQARVFGLGASTKGNMLLQALGFGKSQIECIWDNSSEKIGLFTNGTDILIKAEDFSGDLPDAFLVLPYYYFDAFKDMIAQKIPSCQSVKLIVPLPFPRVEVVFGRA